MFPESKWDLWPLNGSEAGRYGILVTISNETWPLNGSEAGRYGITIIMEFRLPEFYLKNDPAYLQRYVDGVLFFLRTICKTLGCSKLSLPFLLSIRAANFSCNCSCNATMTNKKPFKLQKSCYTQATLRKVEGRSTFLATRNATIAVAKWGVTREFFLATCNSTFDCVASCKKNCFV